MISPYGLPPGASPRRATREPPSGLMAPPAFAKRHTGILATFFKGTTKNHDIRRIASLSLTSRSSASTTKCAA